jgi:hypothetical protein
LFMGGSGPAPFKCYQVEIPAVVASYCPKHETWSSWWCHARNQSIIEALQIFLDVWQCTVYSTLVLCQQTSRKIKKINLGCFNSVISQ